MTNTALAGGTTPPAAGPEAVQPGQYDIPAEEYHADPVPGGSLSSTGARRILECPAKFAYERQHPPAPRDAFDFGSAAHRLVLGDGPDLVCVDADSWRTKAAREERDEVREHGGIPLLPEDYDRVHAMARELLGHPRSAELFPPGGEPEQTFIWRDQEAGVWCRSRVDWLPEPGTGPLTIVDFKTTASANPAMVGAEVYRYGYHQQAAHYLDGIRAVLGLDDVEFRFVFQEKEPPYLVSVVQLDAEALALGAARNREARRRFAAGQQSGIWPGWDVDTHVISLPPWAANRDAEEYLR